ncbi:hypothetical protein MJO29_005211 [Puccinia striiformis f. sp. tritici]|nr:hypothetical protein Pst134EB_010394 [Puccinia striiformis f. sp. tritici]KAI7960143.1 hypothetical protein MJO29_005211 [Puccinia striiformis f. sp. tritici]
MEDIADLNFTSTTNKAGPGNQGNPKAVSSFDYLSATIARSSSSSSVSPSQYHHHQPISRTVSSVSDKPQLQSQDAFSSIFADHSKNSISNSTQQKMTIAERLQAAQNTKLHHQLGSTSALGPKSISGSLPVPHQEISRTSSESWDFDLLEQVPKKNPQSNGSQTTLTKKRDSWGIDPLSDFDPQPEITHTQLPPKQNRSTVGDSLLGDEFGPVEATEEVLGSISLTPDDPPSSSGHDILGLLGAPIDQVNADRIKQQAKQILQSPKAGPSTVVSQRHQSKPSSSSSSFGGGRGRANSPPPHILGQVVEIGFSPGRSRQALIQTKNPQTGDWDISTAVESLLGNTQSEPTNHEDEILSNSSVEPRRKTRGVLPDNGPAKSPESSTTLNAKEIQDQAAELLAQASAYGTTALGKAASFWKQGKASLTKVIEDQTGSSTTTSSFKDEDGPKQPKWMKDAQAAAAAASSSTKTSTLTPFSDNLNHPTTKLDSSPSSDTLPGSSRKPYVSSARRQVTERTSRRTNGEESSSKPSTSTGDLLFSTSSPSPDERSLSTPPRSTTIASKSSSVLPSVKFPNWPIVTVTQHQLQQSENHRLKGNELFKQGQYGDAELCYTKSLETLRDSSSSRTDNQSVYLGSLSIYNNRASARLKNGDSKGALEDIESILSIIFCGDDLITKSNEELIDRIQWNQTTRVPTELSSTFNIYEQVGKALSKRAKIYEDKENWKEAQLNWESCRRLGSKVILGGGGIKIINEGLSRCSKALNPSSSSTADPGSTTKNSSSSGSKKISSNTTDRLNEEKRKTELIGNQRATQAVQRLKIINDQIEEDENLKLEFKDQIDTKIENWKNGKQNNLRALLSSIDTVLWDKLDWKKVNMSELLTDSQVKIKYVKAISKVHPDKIPKDATVVEQMIAKSVFAVLNEAWIATQK